MRVIDRLQFGLIAAALGAGIGLLVGGVIVLTAMLITKSWHPFNIWLIGFSAIFFFVIGVVRGDKAADTVADWLTLLVMFIATPGFAPGNGDGMERMIRPQWSGGPWLMIAYFVSMAAIEWFG